MIDHITYINYVCEKVQQKIKDNFGIAITVVINYNVLTDSFSVGFFHLKNGKDYFYSIPSIPSRDMKVNSIVSAIVSLLRNKYNKQNNLKKIFIKGNRCVCCGAPLKGLKCEYCDTEYEVEV